jgi:hypothetical protein
MKKVFPIDWKKIHPEQRPMSTDMYYTALANRVLKVLEETGISAVLQNEDAMRDAAVRLTAWFEDICSGNMLWSVVNTVSRQRFGKPLPFYDTSNYYPGEPNIQDIQLLLWDIIQSHYQDRIINPENAGIEMAADVICGIFDEEYETAPETEELMEYLADPTIVSDYWKARKAMEWFSLDSYLSLRSRIDLMEAFEEQEYNEMFHLKAYTMRLVHAFVSQRYLMQLTAAEWLSMATHREMNIDITHMQPGGYEILQRGEETFLLRDLISGEELRVQTESFDTGWLKTMALGIKKIFCQLIGYNGKLYQCGTMVSDPRKEVEERQLKAIRERLSMEDNARYSHEIFQQKAGAPIVFLRGIDEFIDFHIKRLGTKESAGFRKKMERYLRENSEQGMVAMMSDPEHGFLTISSAIPAIKAPNNPWYNQAYAQKNALNLMVQHQSLDYYAAVYLVENGMLPDAALTSTKGYEHGRKLVQNNARYMVDYFFAKHKD